MDEIERIKGIMAENNTALVSTSSQEPTEVVAEERKFFDFYRCKNCFGLITGDDEKEALKTGKVCPCGSARYSPTNLTDVELKLPKVLDYCAAHGLEPKYEEATR